MKKVINKPNMITNFSISKPILYKFIIIFTLNILQNTKSELLDFVLEMPKMVSKSKLKHNILASFDVENILSEKIICIQKKKHVAIFLIILNNQFTVFHNAFSAFSTATKFYALLILFFLDILKMLYNNLPLKSQNFQKLANHSHAKRFKNVMRIELADLKNKNI